MKKTFLTFRAPGPAWTAKNIPEPPYWSVTNGLRDCDFRF